MQTQIGAGEIPLTHNQIFGHGPDHRQITLLNGDVKSVLALNKKLKVNY